MELKAYSKINVLLEVMDLENGYHKVNNIMLPIDIYDEMSFEKSDDIYVVDDPFLGDNIIVKAAKLFFEYTKINGGVKVTLKKNIPHAAGLAGGSTDAANTLVALNKMYDANLSKHELLELSARLGSDVGFFILNKPALCTGRGEIINPIDSKLKAIKLLLIKVDSGLSTKEVYQNYQYDNVSKNDLVSNIIDGIVNDNPDKIKANIYNDLANVALKLNIEMKEVYDLLKDNNLSPFVSGSGPTIYLFNPTNDDINKAYDLLKNRDIYIMECNTLDSQEVDKKITEAGNPGKPSGYLGEEMLERMNKSHFEVTGWGLSHVKLNKNDILLDVGCGGGMTINRVASLVDMVYGVDHSHTAVLKSIEYNKEYVRDGKVNILDGNVEKLPFRDNVFDKIITVESFYFWPNPKENLKEIRRILKDNGKFILIADMYDDGKLSKAEKETIKKYKLFNPTLEVFKRLFRDAGLKSEIFLKENTKWICVIGEKK